MKQHIQDYEVNSCTMFLKPVQYGSKIFTEILELDEQYLSPLKSLEIIKKSCSYFGVDYESRKKGTSQLIGYTRKVPIAVEPNNHIFLFPTTSPSRPECIWISHEHVENYRRAGTNQTIITFQNKQSFQFPVSFTIIEGQMLRTSRLKTKLLQRIESDKRKLNFLLQGQKTMKASESSGDYESESI